MRVVGDAVPEKAQRARLLDLDSPRAGSPLPRSLAAGLLPLLCLASTHCSTCRPDETLAQVDSPRRARLVHEVELGSRLSTVDHVELRVDGVDGRLVACSDFVGKAHLEVDPSGTAFMFRCAEQPWRLGRVVAGRLFPDCAPSKDPAGTFAALPPIETAAATMLRCRDSGPGQASLFVTDFFGAVRREVGAEKAADILMELISDGLGEQMASVLEKDDESRAALHSRLCPKLADPAKHLREAVLAAKLCPMAPAGSWALLGPHLDSLAEGKTDDEVFVLDWGLLALARSEAALVGKAACARLTRDPSDEAALLSWLDSGTACGPVLEALTKDPPCGTSLDCNGKVCTETEVLARVEGAIPKVLAADVPRLRANWTQNAGDGHAGYVIDPALLGAAALAKVGPFPKPLRVRNERRHYVRPEASKLSGLPSCASKGEPKVACECGLLGMDDQGLCGESFAADHVLERPCDLAVDDAKKRILGATYPGK